MKDNNMKSIHDRVQDLENTLPELLNLTAKNILNRLVPTMEALVDLIGRERVEEQIQTKMKEAATAEADRKKKELEQLVENGTLVSSEEIGPQSVFVGTETDATGAPKHPGRFQFVFGDVSPQYQEKLLGKTKGFVLDFENGGKFEVKEIFNFAPPKAAEVTASATEGA